MSKKFLTPIEFVNLTTDPTGYKGSVYYNSADNVLKFYDGTTWSPISSGASNTVGDVDGGNAGSTYLSALDGGGA